MNYLQKLALAFRNIKFSLFVFLIMFFWDYPLFHSLYTLSIPLNPICLSLQLYGCLKRETCASRRRCMGGVYCVLCRKRCSYNLISRFHAFKLNLSAANLQGPRGISLHGDWEEVYSKGCNLDFWNATKMHVFLFDCIQLGVTRVFLRKKTFMALKG